MIQNTLNKKVQFINWFINGQFTDATYKQFDVTPFFDQSNYKKNNSHIFSSKWMFMEYLISSPEPPIISITEDGKPVFKNMAHKMELRRQQHYKHISAGELQFARDMKRYFGRHAPKIEKETAIRWVNSYLNNTDDVEKEKLKDVVYDYGTNHDKFISVFD